MTFYRAARDMATAPKVLPALWQQPKQSRTLLLRNRQRVRRLDTKLLRRIACRAIEHACPGGNCDLAVYVVNNVEITRLNESFLRHGGPTDVITFDYTEQQGPSSLLHGEIFVCIEEAATQARRFRTTWQSELVRYIVHGLLHLLAYDDNTARARKRMKAAEDQLLKSLAGEFNLHRLNRTRAGMLRP